MPKRDNRLWLPQNRSIQATMCLCERCGEYYEADREHVCRKRNSYPQGVRTMRVGGEWDESANNALEPRKTGGWPLGQPPEKLLSGTLMNTGFFLF